MGDFTNSISFIKKTVHIKTWAVIILLLQCLVTYSQQTDNYFFRHIDQQEGLAHNTVYDITQDSKGFIWIVTPNGLQRYDGSRFLNFREMINNPYEPRTDGATLFADNKNNLLWVSKNTKFEKLDLTKYQFTVYEPEQLLQNPEFKCEEYIDEYNIPWLLGDKSISIYNPATKKFNPYFTHPESGYFVSDTITGEIWAANYTQGLLLFDKKTKKVYSSTHNPFHHPMLEAFKNKFGNGIFPVRSIMRDNYNNFWLASWGETLYRYNASTKKVFTYTLSAIKEKQTGKKNNNSPLAISCMLSDDHGTVWISTENAGLLKYDRAKDDFETLYIYKINKQTGGYNYTITTIFQDKDGNIWLGTDKGIRIFNPYHQFFQSIRHEENNTASLPKSEINCFIQTKTGDILVGTWGGGITVYDSIWNFKRNIQFTNNIDYNLVWDFIENDDGNIWVGCQNGYIHIYDPVDQSLSTLNPPELNGNTILCMKKDRDGNIWMGLNGGKITKWDKQQNKFYTYPAILQSQKGVPLNSALNIFIDHAQQIWVSTASGLKKFDQERKDYTEIYLPNPGDPNSIWGRTIGGIEQYNDSVLVIGTINGGINFFNTKTKSFSHLTMQNGLPSNTIHALKKDESGYLWFTTDYGVYKFKPVENKFIRYNTEPGFINSAFYKPVFYVLKDGRWMTCTYTEIICFNPAADSHTTRTVKKVEISGLKIFDDPFAIDSLLAANKPVHLTYKQNFLTIEFAALNFSNLQQSKYYYRLSGVNSDWVNAGIKPFASYTNLQPGEYTFSVKTDNTDDLTSVTSFKIIITPPFWRTWWFKSVIAATLVLLVIWVLKRRIKNIRHEAQMKQKIAETEMMALRAQMNPHFIFNCLNSIDNLIQNNEKEKATSYLAKFARLIRAILENSKNNTIPCWKDLETLNLYLELEQLRWDKKFLYQVTVDEKIVNGDYKVPPMIIQPFVENAIHHGLLNKKSGDKKLTIDVAVVNSHIRYVIQDNGVGRKKAAEYKQLNRPTHQSLGLAITKDRIDLFNQTSNGSVKITDLYDEQQQPEGTKVEVELINQ